MGPLQYGQTKTVVIKVKMEKECEEILSATLKFNYPGHTKEYVLNTKVVKGEDSVEKDVQSLRNLFIEEVSSAFDVAQNDLEEAKKIIENLSQKFEQYKKEKGKKTEKRIESLLEDINGQVTEAFSQSSYFSKWGIHYLPSLLLAHRLQYCNNFKDPGVQHYGGKIFLEERLKGDKLFLEIPAPKPSLLPPPPKTAAVSTYTAPKIDMYHYYDCHGGCFGENTELETENGEKKKIKELKKGDFVKTPSGKYSEILCIVKTKIPSGTTELISLPNNLLMTPWHPVSLDNATWSFPCEIAPRIKIQTSQIFNLVLKNEHLVLANSISCVTLGHGFLGDKREHPYYGSQAVVEDLKALPGWDLGRVVLDPRMLKRDENFLVVGMETVRREEVEVM